MATQIDFERLIMVGVMIGALVLWGGMIAEATGIHPNGKTIAVSVTGLLIPLFTAAVILLKYLVTTTEKEADA